MVARNSSYEMKDLRFESGALKLVATKFTLKNRLLKKAWPGLSVMQASLADNR